MKRIIQTALTMILALVSIAGIAATSCSMTLDKKPFCQCYKERQFYEGCKTHFPAGSYMCTQKRHIRWLLNAGGGPKGVCLRQHDIPQKLCQAQTSRFMKNCL